MSGLYSDKEDIVVSEETKVEKELDRAAWSEADTQRHDSHPSTGRNSNRTTEEAVTHSI